MSNTRLHWAARGTAALVAALLWMLTLAAVAVHREASSPLPRTLKATISGITPASRRPHTFRKTNAGRQRAAPAAASSQYVRTARAHALFRMGCGEGHRLAGVRQDSAIVVLAFGRPMYRHGRYGASLFGPRFTGTPRIERSAEAYALGYARCSGASAPRLHVAIGTSNFGPGVSRGHGAAWARMVNRANRWLRTDGLWTRVEFAGANDIELGWNGPVHSKAWVRGYDSQAEWPYYDFGDAAACPPHGRCLGAWTQEDVWYVAWGARSAHPLPEIYTRSGSMAQAWYRLSLYAYHRHGARMSFAGALSQRSACRQSSDPCRGMNNTPRRAWRQLSRALNSDPRTAQDLRWISDFRWSGGS